MTGGRPPRQPSHHTPPQRPGRRRGGQQGRLEVRLVRRFRPAYRRHRCVAQHRPPAPPAPPTVRNVLRRRGRRDDVLTHGAARALGDEPGVDAVLVERVAAVQRSELVAALVILDAHRARVAGAVVHHELIVLAVSIPRGCMCPAAGSPAQEAQHALLAGEHRGLGHGGHLLGAEQPRLRRPLRSHRREVRLLSPL